MGYLPRHQKQLDGSALGGSDCGPTSLSVAIDAATLGAARPTTEAIRRLARDTEGGTTPDDWKRACRAMGVATASCQTGAVLAASLARNESVVIAAHYGKWRAAGFPAYGSFDGWHAMTVVASGENHVWLYDPLASKPVRLDRRKVISFLGPSPIAVAVKPSKFLQKKSRKVRFPR